MGDTEFVAVGVFIFALERHLVVGLKHDELKLDIVCDKRSPLAFGFLLNFDVKLYVVLQLVVLRVCWALAQICLYASLTLLAMPKIVGPKDPGLLKDPIDHLFAELVIV